MNIEDNPNLTKSKRKTITSRKKIRGRGPFRPSQCDPKLHRKGESQILGMARKADQTGPGLLRYKEARIFKTI